MLINTMFSLLDRAIGALVLALCLYCGLAYGDRKMTGKCASITISRKYLQPIYNYTEA